MKKKEKLILGSVIIGLGTVFNLFFTAALHGLLSRHHTTLTLIPLWDCIAGLFTQREQLLLFLSFEGFLCLCCVLFWVQNNRPYQSELVRVAEDIYTPAPVGQYQHGSARWLREPEKSKVFGTQVIDPENPVIRKLLDTGYDDLPFMKEKEQAAEPGEQTETGQDTEEKVQEEPAAPPPVSIKQEEKKEAVEQNEDFEAVDYDLAAAQLTQKPPQKAPVVPPAEKAKEGGKEEKADQNKLFDEGGIVVGMDRIGGSVPGEAREKLYYISDDTHTLTIGATRSGKTRCLVIQSICLLGLAAESMVISDPKAELFHYTAEFLKKLGYEVICLDFKNPEKSTRYNLLQPVIDAVNSNDMERAEMYAWDITNILVGDNVSNEKIWENGEKSTIAAAILCVVVDNKKRPEYQNLTNVYWFIAEMSKSVGGKTPMAEYMKKLPSSHPARALMSIAAVAPSRTKGSFDTSALTTLRLFTSRSVYSVTHKSDYNISEIGSKKQVLFMILPDEKTTYYPIASLMVSQLYELLVRKSDQRGGRLERRVNFVLDEFGNFTKLTDFTNKLTVAGGRGMRFNLFLQSFEQLTQKYDKETAAIVKSNCQTWVYLQADDKETLQDVCDKLGKYTTSAYQLSSQHGRYVNPSSSHSISLVARELLTTDEIRRIQRPAQTVIGRSHPAMMNAPDLSKWHFNRMCGLGDKEHNRKVREVREAARPVLSKIADEISLWNIWVYYAKDLQLKEAQQKSRAFASQMGAIFSEKGFRKGGSQNDEED
ncbi:VirD4-like conjugal transfer protein, CD1115 family [Caproicibacter fermentans]|uniref:Type IV secretory system conjugative DNA transfer family protein n=1 Tax=Caproicibacter fermentans TaxID=2576756 RepID=A0A7G8TF29_9FIRM|nr:type IV secretory system conjugative DNA transfer family protein [Caproicibacter fermentans]QNK42220.1 type IV secretory system conjugative DNA transfer family protein [Caproicibacter fermentans]